MKTPKQALLLAGFAAAAIATIPAFAPLAFAQTGPEKNPAKVEAGTYAVDPYHTIVQFGVSHIGFTTYYGMFSNVSGSLDFNPKSPAGSTVSISVPVDSVYTTTDKLTGELKSDAWLDAKQFPAMTFKATHVAVTGKDEGVVTGDLTLHGVTKPVKLTVHFNGGGINPVDKMYTLGFEAKGMIKRSDFGVKTYLPLIGDEVELILNAGFEKKPN